MSRPVAIIAAALFLCAATTAFADEPADMKLLTGVWEVTALEAFGQQVPGGQAPLEKLVIKDGNLTVYAQGNPVATMKDLRVGLDAGKTPKIMDLVRDKKESLPCIYEVTAEQLKLAMPMVPANKRPEETLPRPDSFDTKGKPVVSMTAKRVKE